MKFEIWREGFVVHEDRDGERLLCTAEGDTFQDACIVAFKGDDYFSNNNGRPHHWGCELFPTQAEAHKKWGDEWKRPQ